jgi:hypothetical protein
MGNNRDGSSVQGKVVGTPDSIAPPVICEQIKGIKGIKYESTRF